MRIFVAEKPSLGRAIAAALPAPLTKGEGFVRAANGDIVTWCIGHLLEQAEPEAYDPSYKQWRLAHLPIVPVTWKTRAKTKTRGQLTIVKRLIKQADAWVHAGDPDREGQLLVDEVFAHCGLTASQRQCIERCLIHDLNPDAIRRALSQLRSNQEFVPLSVSALARTRADWLYGINLTRALTLKGREGGINTLLSVGRVQTPMLGLLVRREQDIAQFQPNDFYDVLARIHVSAEQPLLFEARWLPSESCAAHQDEDGRVLNRALAEHVCARIAQQPAVVDQYQQKPLRQAAPLPFNLSSLQIEAGKVLGLSAQQVLDACQSLYEKHQLITYPRSDCRYLPSAHHRDAKDVLAALQPSDSQFERCAPLWQLQQRTKAWNDAKVGAHHAIIPTRKVVSPERLSANERRVYVLIARFYAAQFLPPWEQQETQLTLRIDGGLFRAQQRRTEQLGWKQLWPPRDETHRILPVLQEGQVLWSGEPYLEEKTTQPPAYFTDASFLAALTGIARFVQNPELKTVLRDTDGLGTEATRAGMIELLFKRRYAERQGKTIRPTALGMRVIAALPDAITTPDLTAHWERQLADISERRLSYEQFMQPLQQQLQWLLDHALKMDVRLFSGVPSTPMTRQRKTRSAHRSAKKTRSVKERAVTTGRTK